MNKIYFWGVGHIAQGHSDPKSNLQFWWGGGIGGQLVSHALVSFAPNVALTLNPTFNLVGGGGGVGVHHPMLLMSL